jgi:hypothetical protein
MGRMELLSVKRIWDEAPHNAFTDLARWNDGWWCTFREGDGHVSGDGALRVIVSDDGDSWESAARITADGLDLRDPKISVTADNMLMLLAGERHRTGETWANSSLTWFSQDGRTWHGPWRVAAPGVWLWRVTWTSGLAWGFGYGCQPQGFLRLYQSRCGRRFDAIEPDAFTGGYPNETKLVFRASGEALCLLRMDGEDANARLGEAEPPWTDWRWRDLGVRIGGPEMIELPDGRLIVCGRLYDERIRTSLLWLDGAEATLTEAVELPSAGDTSYAGMVWHEDLLWVSYYSTHEQKTSIYLAKVRVE